MRCHQASAGTRPCYSTTRPPEAPYHRPLGPWLLLQTIAAPGTNSPARLTLALPAPTLLDMPACAAGYLSLKPCGRADAVDTWPIKDPSGRQWWSLGPDGGAKQADINGKPVNIRVSCCCSQSVSAAALHLPVFCTPARLPEQCPAPQRS